MSQKKMCAAGRLFSAALAVLLLLSLSACTNVSETVDDILAESGSEDTTMSPESEYDFGEDSGAPGFLHYRPAEADDKDGELTYEYEGGEFSLPYRLTATGYAKNVGVRLFMDGEPIPFKINEESAEYEYFHVFDLEKDDEDFDFTFLFTPHRGKAGDTLSLAAGFVYRPDFQPDMVESSGYGMFHNMPCHTDRFHFNVDAPAEAAELAEAIPAITAASQEDRVLTSDLLSIDWVHGGAIDPDELGERVRQNLMLNGEEAVSNFKAGDEPVHATLYLCGIPGVVYKTSFYLDHQPICDAQGNTAFLSTLQKGTVCTMDIEIPAEQIGAGRTFYAISMPCNAEDFPNLPVIHERAGSIFIYQ